MALFFAYMQEQIRMALGGACKIATHAKMGYGVVQTGNLPFNLVDYAARVRTAPFSLV
jgi:hypothetical protein